MTDVPNMYSLRRLLTPDLMEKEPWRDLADSVAEVFYEAIEKKRLALKLARNPDVLSKEMLSMTARMLGGDLDPSFFTTEELNRLVKGLSRFNPEKGKEDFMHFVGWVKQAAMELIPLWNKGEKVYEDFVINGPSGQRVFDIPPGPYYPTTHVGIAVEESKLPTNPAALATYEEQLTSLFYRIAPGPLVLKWISSLYVLDTARLYMAAVLVDGGEDQQLFARIPLVSTIYIAAAGVDSEEVMLIHRLEDGTILNIDGVGSESSQDWAKGEPEGYFHARVSKRLPDDAIFTRNSEASHWNRQGLLEYVSANEPRTHSYINGVFKGWLFEPPSNNFLRWSQDALNSVWKKTPGLAVIRDYDVTPDGGRSYRLTDQSTLVSDHMSQTILLPTFGKICLSFLIRYVDSPYAAIQVRTLGANPITTTLVVNLTDGTTVVDAGSNYIASGVVQHSIGYWRPWIAIDDQTSIAVEVRVYPSWSSSLTTSPMTTVRGSVEFWHAQLEPLPYPTTPIRNSSGLGTRAAERAYFPAPFLSALNGQPSSLLMELHTPFAGLDEQTVFHGTRASSLNAMLFRVTTGSNFQIKLEDAAMNLQAGDTLSGSTLNKIGIGWTPTRIKMFQNGVTQINSAFFPTPRNLERLTIGGKDDGTESFNGHIWSILFSGLDLQDSRYIALTS